MPEVVRPNRDATVMTAKPTVGPAAMEVELKDLYAQVAMAY